MKLPAFQFYPGDWLKDPNLRICSHAARGVWINMLCLMWECEQRGVLATGGRPWSLDEIAGAVGGDQSVTVSHVEELLAKGVCSRDDTGAIFSRRMFREDHDRAKERLKKQRQRHPENCPAVVPPVVPPLSPRSSSSDSFESESEEQKEKKPEGKVCADFSGSGSRAKAVNGQLARSKAKTRFDAALIPLIGRTGNTKVPLGHPQHEADVTCGIRWWGEIWPDDAHPDGAAPRVRRAVELATQAARKETPMAWLTARLKAEGLIE